MTSRPRLGRLLKGLGCLAGVALFIGVALLIAVALQSSLEVGEVAPAALEKERAALLARFGGAAPYVRLVFEDGLVHAVPQRALEPAHPAPIRTLHALAFGTGTGRVVRASVPYWAFEFTRWKTDALGALLVPIEERLGLDAQLPDLAPHGPGLILDGRTHEGRRLLLWAEGDGAEGR